MSRIPTRRDPRYAFPGDPTQAEALNVGDRVWLSTHKRAWTVRARDERYVVLTQPFNPKRTVTYTVIDLELGIRGTSDCWGSGFESDEDVARSMKLFADGTAEISVRNNVTLDIVRVEARAMERYEGEGGA
jgi:hypothetical protein